MNITKKKKYIWHCHQEFNKDISQVKAFYFLFQPTIKWSPLYAYWGILHRLFFTSEQGNGPSAVQAFPMQ